MLLNIVCRNDIMKFECLDMIFLKKKYYVCQYKIHEILEKL